MAIQCGCHVHGGEVLPDYLAAFAQYMCNGTPKCLEVGGGWQVPATADQVEVLRLMRAYQAHYDLMGYDGAVFALLNQQAVESDSGAEPLLAALLQALVQVHDSKETLDAVIEAVHSYTST